ncbi:MAG: creatininase [Hyphomicrobium sp.]|nr:MAG: creatininase [Hyphomicrobium sp.]PPC99032.1 MAG: creatininase [Hyphomicrobium sp.]
MAACLCTTFAHISSAAEIETARMTWPEIRDAVASGKTTILIPSGGTEQNGPHMVTGKHNVIVAETARRIASELGDALVAPVIAYTPEGNISSREGHMAYPGTISISPATFVGILEGAARSFKAHSFKTIVFLGDSGPNQAPQTRVATALQKEWAGEGVQVISANSYYANNGQVDMLKAAGETNASIGHHAGMRDTSELLAIDPAGIRSDKLAVDRDGMSGDSRRASAEWGARLLALKVKAAVAEIRAAKLGQTVHPSHDGGK